ncbi:MAG: MFS transporter [Alphaproteobacteria bacterium]
MRFHYGWVIVAFGMAASCVSVGSLLALSVFLAPVSAELGASQAGIASVFSLAFLAMGVAGFGWGALADRYGTRIVVLTGGALLGLGLLASSRATSLLEFQILFGGIVGAAAGSTFAPLTALTSSWFTRNRGLAVALVSMGMGIGTVTMAPLAGAVIEAYDWRTALVVLAGLATAVVVPGTLLLRPAPSQPASDASGAGGDVSMTVGEAFRTPQFAAIALVFFCCCAAHSGPILHMVSYAAICGASPLTATGLLSSAGAGGLVGRIVMGLVADRVGAKQTLVAGLLLQSVAIVLYAATRDLEWLYVLSICFGFAYGGVMPLYAVLIREYFGARIMGTAFGAVTMVSSIGMALGPLAGGWLYDNYDSYVGMYLGAAAICLGGVLIAATFRPPPAPAVAAAPAT